MTGRTVEITRTRLAAAVGAFALGAGALVAGGSPASADERELARAELQLADGRRAGTVQFVGVDGRVTRVKAKVDLPRGREMPGFHGFHVHANDDPANGTGCVADPDAAPETWFVSADGHLAEAGQAHGQHVGDLPPLLLTSEGRGFSLSITDRLTVADVVGRAVMLHADADNLGNVPTGDEPTDYVPNTPAATDLTSRTGNAGDRIACGVVAER